MRLVTGSIFLQSNAQNSLYAQSRNLLRVTLFTRTNLRLRSSMRYLNFISRGNRMFTEVEMARDVTICAQHLNGQSPHQQIVHRLLKDLIHEKACREHGFYLGITALKSIGNNKNNNDDNHEAHILTFPVSFTCRTFLPVRGDILQGVVNKVLWNGAFIRSGPLRYAYLSFLKMPDYHYVHTQSEDEKPYFQKDDLSKIAVGVVIRFEVLAVRFKERPHKRRHDFYVLATMENDDTLGPISLTGSDEPYM